MATIERMRSPIGVRRAKRFSWRHRDDELRNHSAAHDEFLDGQGLAAASDFRISATTRHLFLRSR
jgi:hypothetical protein